MSDRTAGIASAGTDMILKENWKIQKRDHEKSPDCLLPFFTRQKNKEIQTNSRICNFRKNIWGKISSTVSWKNFEFVKN
jgi:hypothetical protein